MAQQHPDPAYALPPPFSPPLQVQQRPYDPVKPDLMEIENATVDERTQRAASVLSGMSAEDMEAAETLKSLHRDVHSPRIQTVPPTHLETRTTYNAAEPEPLLSLITSQYPLAASVINSSLSIYKTAQSYTPGGEWTERNVGLPLARKTARISGVEKSLRWALQPKRDSAQQLQTPDVEKGYLDLIPDGPYRHSSDSSVSEILPAYSAGDRSPPYSEQKLVLSREQQPPPGWRQQLVITTSGLGVAMSDESLKSLRYCLSWLRWANGKLGSAVQVLKDLLEQWDRDAPAAREGQSMSVLSMTQNGHGGLQAELTARIAALKAEVLQTLKQVVNVVSTYAGGALPNNARELVHHHLVSLPQRFSIASSRTTTTENGNEVATNANRVLVLAQEGLDMMNQVSRVVNDTLVSAEGWCEKLGKRRSDSQPRQQSHLPLTEKSDDRERSVTLGREQAQDTDVKMDM